MSEMRHECNELNRGAGSVWGSSPWSPVREMVCLACCDVRTMRVAVSQVELFKHRNGKDYERRLAHAKRKLAERQEIVRRLFETRHFHLQNAKDSHE